MELIKVNKNKNLVFKLKDGRIGITYNTGYVRVSTKGGYQNAGPRMYQINKQVLTPYPNKNNYEWYNVKRELIPNQTDRIQHLLNFETKNCNGKRNNS